MLEFLKNRKEEIEQSFVGLLRAAELTDPKVLHEIHKLQGVVFVLDQFLDNSIFEEVDREQEEAEE